MRSIHKNCPSGYEFAGELSSQNPPPNVMAIIKPLTLYSAIKLNIIASLYPYRTGDKERLQASLFRRDLRGSRVINPVKLQ